MKQYAYVFVLLAFILPTQAVLADEASSTPDTATSTPVIIDIGSATSTSDSASSTPPVATSTPLVIDGHVDVPATCEALDTDGVAHEYAAASSSAYIAICAVEAAKEAGIISKVGLSNQFPAFGLFVTQINDVIADPSSQYWALYQNGAFAALGITSLPIAAGDTLQLQLHDFSDNDLGDRLTLHIDTLIATSSATTTAAMSTTTEDTGALHTTSNNSSTSGAGGGGGISHSQLNTASALSFLTSKQNADGSFDSDLLSDWAAVAFAASDPGIAKTKLRAYLVSSSPALQSATDYERHAMALEALGIDPSTGTSIDTISHIVNAFDGTQIGDPGLVNDDIFALFPLLHAGYSAGDPIIAKTVAFIVSKQKADGSWDESVDLTAAAIQAIELVPSLPDVPSALRKAESYLRTKQQQNGGWQNSFSTSWALQAIAALGESPSAWDPIGYTPQDYLASLQQSDGGVEAASTDASMRTWATEYAIPAALGKPWSALFSSFDRPSSAPATLAGTPASASATSTAQVASSTPAVATSTPITTLIATSTISVASPTPPEAISSISTSSDVQVQTPTPPQPQIHHAPKASAPPHPPATPSPIPSAQTPLEAMPLTGQTAAASAPQNSTLMQFLGNVWQFITHVFTW